MNKLFTILFCILFILNCTSDINSENILTDSGTDGDSSGEFTGGGNQTISELTVELITTYNDQTASFSTNYGNYQRNIILK